MSATEISISHEGSNSVPMIKSVFQSAPLCCLLFSACLTAPFVAHAEQNEKKAPPVAVPPLPRKFGPIEVSHFREMNWEPNSAMIHFEGGVVVLYTDPIDGMPTTLNAETVDYNLDKGELQAKGDVTDPQHPLPLRVTRQDTIFTGQEISVNLKDGLGTLTNAEIQSEFFHLSGERIELRQGVYLVTRGTYTTCIHRHPDYHITAKDIRLEPGKSLKAHNITFYAGPTRLFTLPYYKRGLSHSTGQGFPFTPAYNKHDGLGVHYQDSPLAQSHEVLRLDILANLKRAPTGYAAYQKDIQLTADPLPPSSVISTLTHPLQGILEQTAPPTYQDYTENIAETPRVRRVTMYGVVQNQQFLYNRKYTDLSISRFPEVGVRFLNLFGSYRPDFGGDGGRLQKPPQVFTPPHNFGFAPGVRPLLDVIASVGAMEEFPTHTTAGRIGVRASLASPQFLLGKRLSARVGVSDWAGFYSTGDTYTLFSPEVEFNYVMTRTSRFNAGYSFFTDLGQTPFLFDRRDVRQEMRLSYHVEGPVGFGYTTKLDIGRSRFYDSELALTRNFDCMQIGLSYRLRSQSIGIIFNFTPPVRRSRAK